MGRPVKYTMEHDDEITRKYVDDKMSLSSLSKEYGIPVMTIKRRLIKRGIAIRNISTAMTLSNLRKSKGAPDSGKVTGEIQHEGDAVFLGGNSGEEWLD